jgi:hypothetical protein
MWVSDKTLESKRAFVTFKHLSSPHEKEFKALSSLRKIMATVFWDHKYALPVDFLQLSDSATTERFCGKLERLQQAIRRKRLGFLRQDFIIITITPGFLLLTGLVTNYDALAGKLWTTLLGVPISGPVIAISVNSLRTTWLESDLQQTPTLSKLLSPGYRHLPPTSTLE